MTDLDAFFAKKASKGKKKGVIKLEEIGEQLERRAMEQRDGTDDNENKPTTEDLSKIRPTNENNEDSEWLGFDDKPSAPVAIKEMSDSYVESEDEEKRASAEPAKTWKTKDKEITDEQPIIANIEPAKYVVKAKKQTQLDLTSDEMFPSIEKAPEVELKLKEQEEINRRIKLEERKQHEEQCRADGEKRNLDQQKREQKRQQREQEESTSLPSDSQENWRALPSASQEKRTLPSASQENWRTLPSASQEKRTLPSDSQEKRTLPSASQEKQTLPSDSQENWRTKSKPPTTSKQTSQAPQAQPAAGERKVYVPPHLRKNGDN